MSFNPQEVFTSLQTFLSSGYVALAIIVLLGIGFVKKIIGLLITGGVIFAIWFFCQDQIYAALQELAQRLPLVLGWVDLC